MVARWEKQEVSIRVSRLAEEPGEFWSSAAASLKPSVRVMIAVGGLGQAQDDAGRGSTRVGAGGGGDSRGSGCGGGDVAAARDSRLRCGAQRASRGQAGGGRQQVSGDSSSRLSRLCPVGQSGLCGALRARSCHRASVFPWPGLSWLVHAAVGRGRNATRRGETRDEWTERWRGEAQGTRHKAR